MVENQAKDRGRHWLTEAIKHAYLKAFDGFVVGGSTHRSYLTSLGVRPEFIRQGYDCVDNDGIARLAAAFREIDGERQSRPPYFLCICRLLPRKNVPFVVRAYIAYRRSLPPGIEPWQLVIGGDGPERKAVQDAAMQGGSSGIQLIGQVDDFEVLARYYAACGAFILASSGNEPWGLVVNEAMAAGAPVLVSKACGCAPELVREGTNGFTFDPTDESQLTRLMLWLHEHPDRASSMGTASQEIGQRFPRQFLRPRCATSRSRVCAPDLVVFSPRARLDRRVTSQLGCDKADLALSASQLRRTTLTRI